MDEAALTEEQLRAPTRVQVFMTLVLHDDWRDRVDDGDPAHSPPDRIAHEFALRMQGAPWWVDSIHVGRTR